MERSNNNSSYSSTEDLKLKQDFLLIFLYVGYVDFESLKSQNKITFWFNDAIYQGKIDKKGEPIGGWTRIKGDKMICLTFKKEMTVGKVTFTNTFLKQDSLTNTIPF